MRVEWTDEFDDWLTRVEERAEAGDERAGLQLDYVAAELQLLTELNEPPTRDEESAQLRWVRQHGRHEVWRVSHRFDEQVAVRLIVWFPPDSDTVVVTVFGGDKKRIGDAFYNSVGPRADAAVTRWQMQQQTEANSDAGGGTDGGEFEEDT